ncbi:LamG-like jellyroll fold domain-containing protein [Bifidobacterium avesanii]|nr:LamG-like jellyroll fold domain-containing protein [Bifidobacterium avesanii]
MAAAVTVAMTVPLGAAVATAANADGASGDGNLLLDAGFATGAPVDSSANKLVAKVVGSPRFVAQDGDTQGVGTFHGDDAVMFPFSDGYAKIAQTNAVSMECTFKFNGDIPQINDGQGVDICSGKEGGGISMTASNGKARFWVNVEGKYKEADGTTVLQPDTWYDMVASWDGSKATLYLNGKQEGQVDAAGKIKLGVEASRNMVLGGDADGKGGAQFFSATTIARGRVWSRAVSSAEAATLSADALKNLPAPLNLTLASSMPAEGQHYAAAGTIAVALNDPSKVDGVPSVKIDGVPQTVGAQFGPGLGAGNHVMDVSWRDVYGYAGSAQVHFTTDNLSDQVVVPDSTLLDVDFADGIGKDQATGQTPMVTNDPAIAKRSEFAPGVATFDGDDALLYKFKNGYDDIARKNVATIECTFKYNGTLPTASEEDICSGKESGGLAVYTSNGKAGYMINIAGSYKSVLSSTELKTGVWYDVIVIWDGKTASLYLNGEQEASVAADGPIQLASAETARNIVLGGDATSNDRTQFYSRTSVSRVRIWDVALDGYQAHKAAGDALEGLPTATPTKITSTIPAEGQHLNGPVELTAVVENSQAVDGKVHVRVDGEDHTAGDVIGEGMDAGDHVAVFSYDDAYGFHVEQTVHFTSATIPTANGTDQTVGDGSALLQAAAGKSGDDYGDVTTTFSGAAAVLPKDGATQGVVSDIPTTLDFAANEGTGSIITDPLKPGDGQSVESAHATVGKDGLQEIPYQRFDVDASTLGADGRAVVWQGTLDSSREAVMRLWNVKTKAWDVVGAAAGSTSGNAVTIRGEFSDAYVDAGTVHVLVTGEDPFADDLPQDTNHDTFEDPADYDFAIAHFSDTQYLSQGAIEHPDNPQEAQKFRDAYLDVTKWIVNNAKQRKIAFTTHTGDIIEDFENPGYYEQNCTQWDGPQWKEGDTCQHLEDEEQVASNAQKVLDDAGMPNGVLAGNHDSEQGKDYDKYFNKYFGPSRYEAVNQNWQKHKADYVTTDWSYHPYVRPDGTVSNENHYDLFTVAGLDFIDVQFGYDVTPDDVAWANKVLHQYADRNAIIATHALLAPSTQADGRNGTDSHDGAAMQSIIKANPNVFLAMGGHEHGVAVNVDKNVGQAGNDVIEYLADYQFYEVDQQTLGLNKVDSTAPLQFGSSFLRLLQFNTKNSTMSVDAYSPLLNSFNAAQWDTRHRYGRGADDYTVPVQLQTRTTSFSTDALAATATGTVIGQATVKSGMTAQVEWKGLTPGKVYAWKAVSFASNADAGLDQGGLAQYGLFLAAGTEQPQHPDKVSPTFSGVTDVTVSQGSSFDPLAGVKATDDVDGDVTSRIVVKGSVDTSKPGVTTVTYTVSDKAGNQAVASRKVTVTAKSGGNGKPGDTQPDQSKPDQSKPGETNSEGNHSEDNANKPDQSKPGTQPDQPKPEGNNEAQGNDKTDDNGDTDNNGNGQQTGSSSNGVLPGGGSQNDGSPSGTNAGEGNDNSGGNAAVSGQPAQNDVNHANGESGKKTNSNADASARPQQKALASTGASVAIMMVVASVCMIIGAVLLRRRGASH